MHQEHMMLSPVTGMITSVEVAYVATTTWSIMRSLTARFHPWTAFISLRMEHPTTIDLIVGKVGLSPMLCWSAQTKIVVEATEMYLTRSDSVFALQVSWTNMSFELWEGSRWSTTQTLIILVSSADRSLLVLIGSTLGYQSVVAFYSNNIHCVFGMRKAPSSSTSNSWAGRY